MLDPVVALSAEVFFTSETARDAQEREERERFERRNLDKRCDALLEEIANMAATTIDGVFAKLKIAGANLEGCTLEGSVATRVAASAAVDAFELALKNGPLFAAGGESLSSLLSPARTKA